MADDYYKILGVPRNASEADIQKAYRDLARKYHPDMNPDSKPAKEKFKQVQQAYDVLNNAEKRAQYDQFGPAFEQMHSGGGGHGPFPGGGGSFEFDLEQMFGGGGGGGGGFGDIFRQFGAGGTAGPQSRRRAPRKGRDVQYELSIPLNTAVKGGKAQVSLRRPSGKVENIQITIPAGMEDGKTLKVRGQGEPSPDGGDSGDLRVTVKVGTHPHFTRRGKNLELKLPISIAEAALGGKVDVPTPNGTIGLTIPPNSSSGKRLRVPGHGVASGKNAAGDLVVEIQIVMPEELDDQCREWLQQIDQKYPVSLRDDLQW